ncbi:15-hydroxyprostaglandin dehydrogenase [NAD(+)]-like [Ostrinia furnacalis]|uniref:15-hydroxyprostaglandin dehydrogenase [NAD(+)]-like n=1 Tax=Ostrinia furnacalis TaxID=93504 RepID=UPI00103E407B|nr:15-hydroxyprostaglandin dehydrogenase [NAD(+)]-like [Ostrinia furnacalis]
MEKEIKNKVAIVTGGSKGIGSAIVEEFLCHGAKAVVIVDREESQGIELMEKLNIQYGDGKAIFFKADVTRDLDEIYKKVVEKYQTIDILVNNAGIVDETSIRRTLDVNTIATVEWSMKFLNHMRKDKGGNGGTILNIASIYGYTVDPVVPFYKTSKFAVMGFTRTLGHVKNYEITKVRVFALCPGLTRTSIHAAGKLYALDFLEEVTRNVISTVSYQEKEDVAKAAIEAFKTAQSGSAWSIINGEPIQEIV